MNTAAIAQHLNIAEAVIANVEEWAHVLFVRFVGRRPRFVSKKVVEVSEKIVELTGIVRRSGRNCCVRRDGTTVALAVTKKSNQYGLMHCKASVGTVFHLDGYTRNGFGKGQTGWFQLEEDGSLTSCAEPALKGSTAFPHEIYEELSLGRAYEG